MENLPGYEQDMADKIVVGFERVAEAFRVLLWEHNKEFGLSPIQIRLLIFISDHDRHYCKVSYLAQEFNLTKATVSDAVKVLFRKDLIEKEVETADTRSYTIQLTTAGKKITEKLVRFADAIKQPIEGLSSHQQVELWQHITMIIKALQKSGIISLQRMCYTCSSYEKKRDGHYCHFLKMDLRTEDLRIDCPEHTVMA